VLTSGFLCGSRTINHVVLQLSSERRAQSCDEPSSRWRAKEHTVTSMVGKETGLSSVSSLPSATSPGPCPDTLHSGCCFGCVEPVAMRESESDPEAISWNVSAEHGLPVRVEYASAVNCK